MLPDREQAELFLSIIAPGETRFTFQTLDDSQDEKDPRLARIVHGTLIEHLALLASLNAQGAGVFVTINQTDFGGRKAENIVKVRCLFLDHDGTPLAQNFLVPHVVVETSAPEHLHEYWRAEGVTVERFSAFQKELM
jgi:hypothetical protein